MKRFGTAVLSLTLTFAWIGLTGCANSRPKRHISATPGGEVNNSGKDAVKEGSPCAEAVAKEVLKHDFAAMLQKLPLKADPREIRYNVELTHVELVSEKESPGKPTQLQYHVTTTSLDSPGWIIHSAQAEASQASGKLSCVVRKISVLQEE